MEYFVGIDGGGTKTACVLVDETGTPLARAEGQGTSWTRYGKQAVADTAAGLYARCAEHARVDPAHVRGVCFGMPIYGENPAADAEIFALLNAHIPNLLLVNDTQVGWAGSLACGVGINVVSGTGSIAFGCNEAGQTARSGGWAEHFSDEGSSYWLAKRGMELFTKQADGRLPRGALYALVRDTYHLEDDFAFVPIAMEQLLPYREKMAAFHVLVSHAGDAGDETVLELYRLAAQELYSMAHAIKQAIPFSAKPVPVSYSGGTFKAGQKLIAPLAALLEQDGMRICAPLLAPVEGAALLAVQHFGNEYFDAARANMLRAAHAMG